jgi:hypothetical protein
MSIASSMSTASSRRNAGTAAVLSVLIPGIGQIYNGDFLRGVFWLIVTPGMWIGTGGLRSSRICDGKGGSVLARQDGPVAEGKRLQLDELEPIAAVRGPPLSGIRGVQLIRRLDAALRDHDVDECVATLNAHRVRGAA